MQDFHPVCPHCQSSVRQIKYGCTPAGSRKWQCHACKRVYTPQRKVRGFSPETRHQAVKMYLEGINFRRIGRLLGVSHQAAVNWVNAYSARLKELHPEPPRPDQEQIETVELDEMYARLLKKGTGST